ncbi:MAG: transposase [Burkholderiaceae bacterium]|nr:transposase [Burkholderiaceae bacterium]
MNSRPGTSGPTQPDHRQAADAVAVSARSRFTCKLHIRGNAHGLPIALHVTAGQEADCSNCETLMEARDSDPAIMLGGKGYDSHSIRQDLDDRGAVPEVPTKRNCHVQHSVIRPLYALGSRIECFINRLKNKEQPPRCHRLDTSRNPLVTATAG